MQPAQVLADNLAILMPHRDTKTKQLLVVSSIGGDAMALKVLGKINARTISGY